MSLILDALKRAERERKLEKAPDLSAIYQEGRLNPRKYYPWFWVGGASLAAFVILAFLFWPEEPSRSNIKDKTPKAALTASAPAKQLPPKAVSQPLSTAKKPVSPPPVSGGEDKQPKIEPKSDLSKAQTPTPQKNSKQPSGVDKKNLSPREKLAAEPVKQIVTPRRTKDRPKAAVAVVPSPKPKVTLPSIRDLPEDIQSALGPLEINVHMYSQNPSERRVFINMKGYREGDTIGESGFKLTEITPYGVIIDYGKGKAVLGVKHK
jgi:hypothetical protein